jgi:hypothetical protein
MRLGASALSSAALLPCVAAVEAAAVACSAAANHEGVDGSVMAEAESEQMQAELVQTRAHIFKSQRRDFGAPQLAESGNKTTARFLRTEESAVLSAEQRASFIVPIAWFHVPKTGSSIENTFYHTPAICPSFPEYAYASDWLRWDDAWGDRTEVCGGGFSSSYGTPPLSGILYDHGGIGGLAGPAYKLNRGHFVTMLRNPEQRLISMYNYYGPMGLRAELMPAAQKQWPYNTQSPGLREYAEFNAGCTVRQLTIDDVAPCWAMFDPTLLAPKVSEAIEMLQDGFVFVGITEQWALSVCLFRAMFGGQCRGSDFVNTRPGVDSNSSSSSSGYDTSELYGWVDPWDGPLYAEALSIFDSARKVYNAHPEWCAALCEAEVDDHGRGFGAGFFHQ